MPTTKTSAQTDTNPRTDTTSYELLNYRLHECIGQEELAIVYSATHLTLDRPVQVHILRRPDWVSISRFQFAGRLLARLNHPNLLPVIDAGHDERLGDYIVTPMLDAQRLGDVVAHSPLEVPQILRVATQIAAALDYLHTQQIIHRDVQPDNILITPQGMAYLKNLSLATGPDAPEIGTVEDADYLTAYSAPEQHLDTGEASPALDVYGLGAVVYHMLSGEIPPPPGSDLPSLTRHNPAMKDADRVLQRMLAPEPGGRFASAGEAVAALRHALRAHIDSASDDMEVSRWQPVAQWLENPLETLLLQVLEDDSQHTHGPGEAAHTHTAEAMEQFQESIRNSRVRADNLHRGDAIRRLLNRWSRKGFFRRTDLGKLLELDQVVSYNLYFYDLRTLYETRQNPQPHQRPLSEQDRISPMPIPSPWNVVVPETAPFTPVKPQELVLPNSLRVMECYDCHGSGEVVCTRCEGQGFHKKSRKVRNADDSISTETVSETCQMCHGYGKLRCTRCESKGKLVEEDVFLWSRSARLWQNTDDLEDLPRLAIQQRTEDVCSAAINPYDGHWHSVPPLAELLQAAIEEVDSSTRLKAAELSIRSVPITEVDYQISEKPQRLYIIGYDNVVVGNWRLLNFERVALAVIMTALLIAAVVWGVMVMV